MSLNRWIQRREYGWPLQRGDRDLIMHRVYSSIQDHKHWNDLNNKPNQVSEFGAVFNLEFSPEGNVLVAACEKKSILLFDAITTKQTHKITDAHSDNVNCIKFLDDRMFATCSDDTTVALWDLRYLKMKVRSLHGHSNWVKNIEYSQNDKLLVTSGFDGSIFTWDINSHTEQGLIYQKVFHTSGLMRCRLSPDGSKLVICSTGGYLMIIHSLDLTTLHKDLCGFRPSMYRLMQMGHQYIPQAAKFDHVFSKKQKKNRVELVTDFPEDNDAEVVLALQIHPCGHSILSRNISYDEKTEWSCIHNINEEPGDITERMVDTTSSRRKRKLTCGSNDELPNHLADEESGDSTDEVRYNISRRQRTLRSRLTGRTAPPPPPPPPPPISSSSTSSSNNANPQNNDQQQVANRPESFVPDIWAAEVTVEERAIRQNRARTSNSVTGYNYVYAISSGVLPAAAANLATAQRNSTGNASLRGSNNTNSSNNSNNNSRRRISLSLNNDGESPSIRLRSSFSDLDPSNDGSSTSSSDSPPPIPIERIRVRACQYGGRQIFQNPKKLMYYIVEPNKGKGFIKEPCFSADGRIICSPYDNGIRLLGFTDTCSEYPRHSSAIEVIKREPRPLVVIKEIKVHQNIVLSTKFSPREPLLVTGCKNGKIVWYHPNL
uniref:WD_REPEATS_REGION domain-containing protein n=1 Tax=Glossina austeni TaxID=7395 RepID=A0A1A9VVF7_GLOAU